MSSCLSLWSAHGGDSLVSGVWSLVCDVCDCGLCVRFVLELVADAVRFVGARRGVERRDSRSVVSVSRMKLRPGMIGSQTPVDRPTDRGLEHFWSL